MTVREICEQVRRLTPEEREQVRAALGEEPAEPGSRRSWLSACGAVPYPYVGEDAQAWVTRMREEGDRGVA